MSLYGLIEHKYRSCLTSNVNPGKGYAGYSSIEDHYLS